MFRPAISFVARTFGQMGVKELEKISTALYVTKEMQGSGCDVRAGRITERKPHISSAEAEEAVRFVDGMVKEAAAIAGGAD